MVFTLRTVIAAGYKTPFTCKLIQLGQEARRKAHLRFSEPLSFISNVQNANRAQTVIHLTLDFLKSGTIWISKSSLP